VLDVEDIYWIEEQGFTGWIGARNNRGRTSSIQFLTIIRIKRDLREPALTIGKRADTAF
jgi:hypothetical protein